MEHTLNSIIKFSSNDLDHPNYKRINSFSYDHSGHVVATNSHVLFATKKPFEINKAGRTFSKTEFEKGYFVEIEEEFPDWKQALPQDAGRKVTIKIPEWFELFDSGENSGTMILDYTDVKRPFFKTGDATSESSLAFNMKYLSCFAGEEISFVLSSPLHPVLIISKDSPIDPLSKNLKEDTLKEDWFYILMPIMLEGEELREVYI